MTDQEIIVLRAKITSAENQYDKLITGRLPRVIVDQNGERVEFTAANSSRLALYIADLKSQLPGSSPVFSGPIRFFF